MAVLRKYRGRSRFLCGGRCMTGPVQAGPTILWYSIVLVFSLWATIVAPRLWVMDGKNQLFRAVVIVPCVMLAITFACFLSTACRDPGVLPRHSYVPPCNRPEGVRWCHVCNIVMHKGVHHCDRCDNCVIGIDHHCPLLGTCIGARTLGFFYMFQGSATCLCYFVIGTVLIYFLVEDDDDRSGHGMTNSDIVAVILLVLFIIVAVVSSVLFLLWYFSMWPRVLCRGSSRPRTRERQQQGQTQGGLRHGHIHGGGLLETLLCWGRQANTLFATDYNLSLMPELVTASMARMEARDAATHAMTTTIALPLVPFLSSSSAGHCEHRSIRNVTSELLRTQANGNEVRAQTNANEGADFAGEGRRTAATVAQVPCTMDATVIPSGSAETAISAAPIKCNALDATLSDCTSSTSAAATIGPVVPRHKCARCAPCTGLRARLGSLRVRGSLLSNDIRRAAFEEQRHRRIACGEWFLARGAQGVNDDSDFEDEDEDEDEGSANYSDCLSGRQVHSAETQSRKTKQNMHIRDEDSARALGIVHPALLCMLGSPVQVDAWPWVDLPTAAIGEHAQSVVQLLFEHIEALSQNQSWGNNKANDGQRGIHESKIQHRTKNKSKINSSNDNSGSGSGDNEGNSESNDQPSAKSESGWSDAADAFGGYEGSDDCDCEKGAEDTGEDEQKEAHQKDKAYAGIQNAAKSEALGRARKLDADTATLEELRDAMAALHNSLGRSDEDSGTEDGGEGAKDPVELSQAVFARCAAYHEASAPREVVHAESKAVGPVHDAVDAQHSISIDHGLWLLQTAAQLVQWLLNTLGVSFLHTNIGLIAKLVGGVEKRAALLHTASLVIATADVDTKNYRGVNAGADTNADTSANRDVDFGEASQFVAPAEAAARAAAVAAAAARAAVAARRRAIASALSSVSLRKF